MPRNISHPANRHVLAYLLVHRIAFSRAGEVPPEPLLHEDDEIGLSDLRTHPDLGSVLREAAERLPGVRHGFVLGYNVLLNSGDIIFALAMGTTYLAFRLNPWGHEPRPVGGHSTIESLSGEWVGVGAFGTGWSTDQVDALCRQALANADKLSALCWTGTDPVPD